MSRVRLLDLLGPREVVILSPLSPRECGARLSDASDGLFRLFGKKPVIGSVGDRGGELRQRRSHRNAFRTVMSLRFEQSAPGCRIIARSFMSVFALAFMALWIGLLGIGLLTTLGAAIDGKGEAPLLMVVVPLLMMAFGVGLLLLGRWMARDEHAFLLAFLIDEVDGRLDPGAARQGGAIVS